MRQELIEKFKDFEKELDKLKTANEHIETSKNVAKKSFDLLEKTSGRLIEHFDKVFEKIEMSNIVQQNGQKDTFEKLKQNLQNYQNEVKKATEELFLNLSVPSAKFNELTNKSDSLIAKIDEINFPERLDKLENSVNTTFTDILQFNREVNKQAQELIQEISKINFESLFSGLKNSISNTVTNISSLNKDLENEIKKHSEIQNAFTENLVRKVEDIDIPVRFKNLNETISHSVNEIKSANTLTQNRTEELTKAIEAINISQRLDKLDATIAGITQSIQSVLQRMDTLERNIKDGQVNKAGEIINQLKSNDKDTKDLVNHLRIDFNKLINSKYDDIILVLTDRSKKFDKDFKRIKTLNITSILLLLSAIFYFVLKYFQ